METKLTIKELSAYLPYDLKWYCLDKPSGEYELYYMTGVFSKSGEMQVQVGNYDISLEDDLEDEEEVFKPILRPLSDLKNTDIDFTEYFKNRFNMDTYLWDVPYSDMEKLFENHYDVFGLIEKGLAIDINTI